MYETHVCMKTINRHTLTNNTVTLNKKKKNYNNYNK